MKIVAESEGGGALLLVERDGATAGQVLDLEANRLYPPMFVQSILARGYWHDYTGDQDAEERLKGVEVITPPDSNAEEVPA